MVDDFISRQPAEVQKDLRRIRSIIRANLPDDITERISYGIPAYSFGAKRAFVFFNNAKDFYSLYPLPKKANAELQKFIDSHKAGAGTLRIVHGKKLPEREIALWVRQLLSEQ